MSAISVVIPQINITRAFEEVSDQKIRGKEMSLLKFSFGLGVPAIYEASWQKLLDS